MPNKKIDDASRRDALAPLRLAARPALLYASGCKKEAEASPTPATAEVPGQLRFAFVTNNSSKFWNIAEKGLRKAEKDSRDQGGDIPPTEGRRRRSAALPRGYPGPELRRRGHQPDQPGRHDRHPGQGGRPHPGRLPRLRRSQVEAQELRGHEQRRGRASRAATRRSRRSRRRGSTRARSGSSSDGSTCRTPSSGGQGVEEKLKTVSRARDPPGVPRQHRSRQGEEEHRGRARSLPRSGARGGALVLQRSLPIRRDPRVGAQQKPIIVAFDEEEETLKADRRRSDLGHHRPEALRVRLPVDEAPQRVEGGQGGPTRGRHRHRHRRKGQPPEPSGRSSASSRSEGRCSSSTASRSHSAACRP